jgi:hypothetical protein
MAKKKATRRRRPRPTPIFQRILEELEKISRILDRWATNGIPKH